MNDNSLMQKEIAQKIGNIIHLVLFRKFSTAQTALKKLYDTLQSGTFNDTVSKQGGNMESFEKELSTLINRHSMENESNTPDGLLAQYLVGCLAVFTTATQQRETWYGRDPRPSST